MIYLQSGVADPFSPMVLFQNLFAQGTLTATSTAAGSFVENLLGPQTFDFWKPAALPAEFSVTLAAPAACDCIALDAHNLGTAGASVSLYYSVTDTSAWVLITTIAPTDDRAAAVIFPSVTGRRFRVVINSASGTPFIGIAMAGLRLSFPGEILAPYVPAQHAVRVEPYPSLSMGGQFQGSRVKWKGAQISVQFSPLARAWVDANMRAFQAHYDAVKPFFWASCPGKYPQDIAYVWRAEGVEELRPAYDAGGLHGMVMMELAAYGA